MKRSAIALLVVVTICAPKTMLGQRPSLPSIPQSISLREAVDMAVHYNPSHRQVANDHGPAAWGVRNAFASFLPSFSLNGSAGFVGAGSQNLFGGFTVEQPSSSVNSSYSLGMNVTLNGRTLMQPGNAMAQLEAADASIESSEINIEAMVKQQYLAVLRAQAQADAATVQVERNQEFLRLAQARYEVGQNTMLDVRQAEVNLGQARVTLLQNEQLVTVEKLRLCQQMGVPAPDDPTTIVLSDTFPIAEPAWSLRELVADAQENNPDLVALRARRAAASANERAVKSDWLPSLSLSAGWSGYTQQFTSPDSYIEGQLQSAERNAAANLETCNFRNDIISELELGYTPMDCSEVAFTAQDEAALRSWLNEQQSVFPFDFTRQPFSARLSVSFPIFTQFSRPMASAQASAAADDARESVRARELDVSTAVTQAYYGLRAAHEAIEIQEQNKTAAAEGLRLATERYRVGSGTFFELLDAQLAAQNADRDYINAVYTYHQSIATLESAVGRPLR